MGRNSRRKEILSILDCFIGRLTDRPLQEDQIGERAYLAHFFNPERDEKTHTLIGLEVPGDWDAAIADVGFVIGSIPIPDAPVDFIQMTGSKGVEDYFRNDCKPFYERKRFGFL